MFNQPFDKYILNFAVRFFKYMQLEVHPDFKKIESQILDCIHNFDLKGDLIYGGSRNSIKTFEIEGLIINIKAFKKPSFFKKIIYTFFRPSKAKRSFEFARKLKSLNIGTPQPIAYMEKKDTFGLTESYYVCEHLEYDFLFRQLVSDPDWPEHEVFLRQFTQLCFKMHEHGIEFKDHSPGNTLIKKISPERYEFYLVDLNRMNFHENMSLELRMANLKRLTPKLDMVSIIADEYGKLCGESSEKLFKMLWEHTSDFQRKFHRKQRMKEKFK
jgi:hypothetical protein